MDKDGSGSITRAELFTSLRLYKVPITRVSLYDSTFSRTAWRLYGGAKGWRVFKEEIHKGTGSRRPQGSDSWRFKTNAQKASVVWQDGGAAPGARGYGCVMSTGTVMLMPASGGAPGPKLSAAEYRLMRHDPAPARGGGGGASPRGGGDAEEDPSGLRLFHVCDRPRHREAKAAKAEAEAEGGGAAGEGVALALDLPEVCHYITQPLVELYGGCMVALKVS